MINVAELTSDTGKDKCAGHIKTGLTLCQDRISRISQSIIKEKILKKERRRNMEGVKR